MYRDFFGLTKDPFGMTPDPAFLLLTTQHREALAGLTYAVLQRKGIVVLTGEAGTGKSTLLRRMLQFLPATKVHSSVILNPTLNPAEFLELAMIDFGISHVPASKAQRLTLLQRRLLEWNDEGRVPTLVIDEAHKLSGAVLEEIRLLGNFECSDQKLLQIVLIGQPELDTMLNREDLRQFKQRVAVRLSMRRLSPSEVDSYIRHRWATAGGAANLPFSTDAINCISAASEGLPRTINCICDNTLMLAFAERSPIVTDAHVDHVCQDLHIPLPSRLARVPHPETKQPVVPISASVPSTLERYAAGPEAKATLWGRWLGRSRLRTAE